MQIMDRGDKKISKVFSTDEIRKQARNWSLAGDAGLLAHLEEFSENLFNKTRDTNSQFNELLEYYEEIHKTVDNVTNQFLALQNCQFVENRVYDEESPTEQDIKENVIDENEREKLLLQQYKEAVGIGIKLLDTHFEAVQLPPNSDSDDSDDDDDDDDDADDVNEKTSGKQPVIWKPKNLYSKKKFPLLIGSSEWWEDDHVGLGNREKNFLIKENLSDSESDVENEQNDKKSCHISSSSSLENEKLISSQPKILYDSSDNLFDLNRSSTLKESDSDLFKGLDGGTLSEKSNDNIPKLDQSDMQNQNKNHNELMDKNFMDKKTLETASEDENMGCKQMKVNNEFTRELAAKLGHFVKNGEKCSSEHDLQKEENEKEKLKGDDLKRLDNSLYDDVHNELFSDKLSRNNKIVSKNLFSDSEDDTELFEDSNKSHGDVAVNFSGFDISKSEILPIQNNKGSVESTTKNLLPANDTVTDLLKNPVCDTDDENDFNNDSLFSKSLLFKVKSETKTSPVFEAVKPNKAKMESLFEDDPLEDDDLDIFNTVEKGKDQLFSTNDNSHSQMAESKNTSNSTAESFLSNQQNDKTSNKNRKPLFSETESGFFDNEVVQKKTISFQSSSDDKPSVFDEDVKTGILNNKKSNSPYKFISSSDFFDDDSFSFMEKAKHGDTVSISSSRSSLFDDAPSTKSQLASVFEKDKNNSDKFENDFFKFSEDSLFGKAGDNDLFSESDLKSNLKINDFEDDSLFKDYDENQDFLKDDAKDTQVFLKNSILKNSLDDWLVNNETEKDLTYEISISKKFDTFSENNFLNGLEAEINDLFGALNEHPEKIAEEDIFKAAQNVPSFDQNRSEDETKVHDGVVENDILIKETSKSIVADQEKSSPPDKNNLFGDDEVEKSFLVASSSPKTDLKFSKAKILNSKQNSDSGEGNEKEKVVGKLCISSNLKSRLEAAIKPVSSDSKFVVDHKKSENFTKESKVEDPPPNLLKCPSKDRVKIPGRRRPQSRRARQEAIKNSGINFIDSEIKTSVFENYRTKSNDDISNIINSTSNNNNNDHGDDDNNDENSFLSSKNEEIKENYLASPFEPRLPKSHPLSPSTDEEDFFNVPELDTNVEEDQDLFKNNLFEPRGNSVIDNSSLFEKGPIFASVSTDANEIDFLVSQKSTKAISEMCGEEEKEEGKKNIFSSPQTSKQKPKSIFRLNDEERDDNFGDGDDDDDDDDDDDVDPLFKSQKLWKKNDNLSSEGLTGQSNKLLFDEKQTKDYEDEDEDVDDLFGRNFDEIKISSKTSLVVENIITVPPDENKESKPKSSNNPPFLDPLGLMSNLDT